MRNAQAVFQGDPARYLPAVLAVELSGAVSLVVQVVEILLGVLACASGQQVRIRVTRAAAGPVGFHNQAVGVAIVRLVVDNVLVVEPELHGVGAPHFGDVV